MIVYEMIPNEIYRNFILANNSKEEIQAIDEKPLADIMNFWSALSIYVVSEKAKNVFEHCLEEIKFSEVFYPEMPTEKFYLLIIQKYYDVLDINHCKYQTIRNRYGECRISNINSYAFKSTVSDLDIFRIIVNQKSYDTHLFITDIFKNIVENNNLTGLNFRKVYEF